jgi:hypothetical protein
MALFFILRKPGSRSTFNREKKERVEVARL